MGSRRNTPTGVGKSGLKIEVVKVGQKHPHGCGEETHFARTAMVEAETPPRAWGRDCVTDFALSELRNTPTGVGKSNVLHTFEHVFEKHLHGRGEESTLKFQTI